MARLLRSRLAAACVASAATATLVVGGAWAVTAPTTGVVKACENPSTGVLHAQLGTKCPTGYTKALSWNVQGPRGPQGPAGDAYGVTGTSTAVVGLGTAYSQRIVMDSPAVTTAGTYDASATVTAMVGQGDTVACYISGAEPAYMPVVGPVAVNSYQTLALEGSISMTPGQGVDIVCEGYIGSSLTEFFGGTVQLVLMHASSSGAAAARATAVSPARPPRP